MGTGTMLMAWLTLLIAGQAGPADTSYLNEREFKIPITLPAEPAFRAKIDQLHLYVSSDEGRTWRKEGTASSRDESFAFTAPVDGSYWFNVAIKTTDGQTIPTDIGAAPPGLKVVVDTKKPAVKLTSVERQGADVVVAWDVRDEYLDQTSIRLEYKPIDAVNWNLAPAATSVVGQTRFAVGSSAVVVRLQAKDLAGNLNQAQSDVAADQPVTLTSAPPAPGAPPPNAGHATPLPPTAPPMAPHAGTVAHRAAVGADPVHVPEPPKSAAAGAGSVPPPPAGATNPNDDTNRVIASTNAKARSHTAAQWNASSQPFPTASTARKSNAPVQLVNALTLDLNYAINKIGPSGVKSVELYVTQDDGQTWRLMCEDSDLRPPINVALPTEGVYGFSLVVTSKAGLGKKPPVSGEAPELVVEADTSAPVAMLYRVEADPGRRETLFLLWNATDNRKLASKPVTLRWSERPAGPWQVIAEGIPNTGSHLWQMPEKLPYKVYLQIEVHDLAGNIAIAETPEPVLVDLVEPDSKLIGIEATKKPTESPVRPASNNVPMEPSTPDAPTPPKP
jgi:hypothetical protein